MRGSLGEEKTVKELLPGLEVRVGRESFLFKLQLISGFEWYLLDGL